MQLDAAFRRQVEARLRAFDVAAAPPGVQRRAAVALALVEEGEGARVQGLSVPRVWSREPALVLTRRSETLANHAGQWALPGGRLDDGESVERAALRELQEEVGLRLGEDAVLGRLDDFVTRSGFVISPVVAWAAEVRVLVPNAAEVASIHRIRLREFLRADAPLLEPGEDPARPIMRMPVGDHWIAAPTAAVIYQFTEVCIAGRHTRVAHFDQPLFARR